jgi:four helix bundle protein
VQDFRKLAVWRESQDLAIAVYRATATFPRDERYGLTSQIRRCATSIPAVIAEGCGRGSNADLARFIQIAIGSSAELESHLLLARDLSLIEDPSHEPLSESVIRVRKMLITFLTRLRSPQLTTQNPRPRTP